MFLYRANAAATEFVVNGFLHGTPRDGGRCRGQSAAVKVSYNSSDRKGYALMNATADRLKAAPGFKYSGRQGASKT